MLEKLLKHILYYNIEEDFKDIYTKHRAVVKSTFVESESNPSPNETVKTEKEKNLLQNHIFNY